MRTRIEIRPGRWISLLVYKNEASRPTIFLIHGLGGRASQWREQIQHLQGQYTLIVPDLLGLGDSEKPIPQNDNPYSFEELSQDLQAIFEKFAGTTNFVFGHSYGGVFATFLAFNNRSRIQKLVLIAPVSCQPYKKVPLLYCLPIGLLECMRAYLDRSFEKLAFSPSASKELLKIEKEGRMRNRMYVIKAMLIGMQNIPPLDVTTLQIPVLIIDGKQDKVVPNQMVEQFYSCLPHHQIFTLDEAAHLVHLERSAEVNRIIDGFL